MIVSYSGNGYIRLQNGETIIDIDPVSGRAKSDIVLRTYFDGVAIEELGENEIAFPGEYEIKEIEVQGYASPSSGPQDVRSIYRVKWDDISFVILGDLGEIPDPDTLSDLVEPDVLILPAGRKGVLPTADAVKLIRELEPSVVIPSYDSAPLDLLKEMGQKEEWQDKFVFKKKELVQKAMKIVLLEAKK